MTSGAADVADVTSLVGNDITGLTGGTLIDRIVSTTTPHCRMWQSSLLLPKNTDIALYAVNGSILIDAVLSFYFHEPIE